MTKVVVPLLAALALALASSTHAQPIPEELVGRPVASVQVEADGSELRDPQALALIETRIGEPLAIADVRETVLHLYTLGRYEDIRVDASPVANGIGVVYRLTSARLIEDIEFRGNTALSARRLRAAVTERVRRGSKASRAATAIDRLRQLYRDVGYLAPRIDAAIEPTAPGHATLAFTIDAGVRARVGPVRVEGEPGISEAELTAALGIRPGVPWDMPAFQGRIDRYANELRRRGYYEASIQLRSSPSPDGTLMNVVLDVARGPRVVVTFEGDPVPEERQRELVPVEREHSVDEDLLEDSKRRIEAWLASQGYWRATVNYQRRTEDDTQRVVFTVRKGRPAIVSDIVISGAERVPSAEILSTMRLQRGAPYVDSTFERDRTAITVLYQQRGFTMATVEGSVSRADVDSSGPSAEGPMPLIVRVSIREGPQSRVGTISVDGRAAVSEADLPRVMTLRPGDPFYAPQLRADVDAVTRVYLDRGYRDVSVRATPAFSGDRSSVDLRYDIVEGPISIVDTVIVVGNERTSPATILREVQVRPGAPAGLEALAESQRRLSMLGLFRRVRVDDRPNPRRHGRDVVITVEEAPSTTLGYGVGLEAGRRLRRAAQATDAPVERVEFAPRGFVELGRRNLWGKNRSINVYARASFRERNPTIGASAGYGLNEYRFVGAYREPRVFGWNTDAQVSTVVEQGIRTSFSFRRQALTVDATRRVGRWATLNGRWAVGRTELLFQENFNPSDQPVIDRLFPQVRLSILSGAGVRDDRDDPLDPTRGELVSVESELATRAIGSEVGFVKTLAQGYLYRTVSRTRRVVFAGGVRLGLAAGFRREVRGEFVKDLPASERFYAGGDTTVRGFSLDRLGPLDQEGFPTGGNALVIFNAEMRVPVWRSVGAVAFLDAGNVFKKVTEFAVGDLRAGAGVGLRYKSPVGPLRVDVGFKLDRISSSERPYVVHVSIGQAF